MSGELSERDNAILNCIFNPNLPLEEAASISEEQLEDKENLSTDQEHTKKLEIESVQLAENGNLTEALSIINKAIEIAPQRPSLYNNRAHIFQYLRKFDDAFKDVNKAIELCSETHQKTLSLAHCQRGVLYRKFEKNDLARSDFEVSAKMGNTFSRKQLVELNPYAALCNQMLRQVMDKLK
ncbi:unnamed protein product [Psylliodes chrysocephalus]|uniref:Tetratricopeptide repeat protein 36 n=1 Tax=Psylliodes chrysocephalus TaxID=3402493 RepID=A0A9P0CU98_9CUCU|nr:unnamed protein product [Psylliodes chrysocephala]